MPDRILLNRRDVRDFLIGIFTSSFTFIWKYTENYFDYDLRRFDLFAYDLV